MRELNIYTLLSIGIIILGTFALVRFCILENRSLALKFVIMTIANLFIAASILVLLNFVPRAPLSNLPPHSLGTMLSTSHNNNIWLDQDLAWSPDNMYLSTRCGNQGLYMWNATNTKNVLRCQTNFFDDPTCTTIAWSPDGKYIAAADDSLGVQIWDAKSGHKLMTYQAHKEDGDAVCVKQIAWSPDSLHIASASDVGTIRVWAILSGKQLMVHSEQGNIRVRSSLSPYIAWANNGQYVVNGYSNGNVQIWNAMTGKLVRAYDVGDDMVEGWSPEGTYFASISSIGSKKTIHIRDTMTGKSFLSYHPLDGLASLLWSPNNKYIASFYESGFLQIISTENGSEISTTNIVPNNDKVFLHMAWSPDNAHLALMTRTIVQVWKLNLMANTATNILGFHIDSYLLVLVLLFCTIFLLLITLLTFIILLFRTKHRRMYIWKNSFPIIFLSGITIVTVLFVAVPLAISFQTRMHSPTGTSFYRGSTTAWSPDGHRLVSGFTDGTAYVWDITSGETLLTYRGHTGEVEALSWSPDGHYIASGYVNGSIQIWNAETGLTISTYSAHFGRVAEIMWSPDGRYIASSVADNTTVYIWSINQGRAEKMYTQHTGLHFAWSPDSTRIVSTNGDSKVQIWEAVRGQDILTHNEQALAINALSWSPNGQYIASGNSDALVQIWNATTGQGLYTYSGHFQAVKTVAWSPDGLRILSGSNDSTIQIWDAFSGHHLFTYTDHTSAIVTATWSPDESRIASISLEQQDIIHVWATNSPKDTPISSFPGENIPLLSILLLSIAFILIILLLVLLKKQTQTFQWKLSTRIWIGFIDFIAIAALVIFSPPVIQSSPGSSIFTSAGIQINHYHAALLAWSPDNKFFVTIDGEDNIVQVWNANNGDHVQTYHSHSGKATTLTWSPDGKNIAIGYDDGIIVIWTVATNKTSFIYDLGDLASQFPSIAKIAWSSDNMNIGSVVSEEGVTLLKVFNAKTGKIYFTHRFYDPRFGDFTWSPDGTRFAISDANTLTIMNSQGSFLNSYTANSTLCSVSWSPTGKYIADITIENTTLEERDVTTGKIAFTYTFPQPLGVWCGSILWSSNGHFIGAANSFVYIVDIAHRSLLYASYAFSQGISWIAWSPDSTRFAGSDGLDTTVVNIRF